MQLSQHHFFKWFITLSVSYFLVACSDCEPLDNPGNRLVFGFYNAENFEADSLLVDQPIEVEISSNNAILLLDTLGDSQFSIPLPLEEESFSLVFSYPDTLTKTYVFDGVEITEPIYNREDDQITISFSKLFEPVSPDCGVIVRYKNLEINGTSLNNAEVVYDFIESNDSTNIRIFF